MYCPQCLAEYREGFTECADCQETLVPGTPPPPANKPEVDFVTVLDTAEPTALSLAKAALEEAGINYVVIPDEDPPNPFRPKYFWGFQPNVAVRCRIQVAREDEKEARELLEPLRSPAPDFNDTETT